MSDNPPGVYESMKLHALLNDPVCKELQAELQRKDRALTVAKQCLENIKYGLLSEEHIDPKRFAEKHLLEIQSIEAGK